MPESCRSILNKMVYKKAMTEEERDKIVRNLKTQKTGKWISDSAYHRTVSLDESGKVSCSCHCSLCGDWLTGSDEYPCKGNYCPNCGAKMEGAEECI